jgi:uncharacterized membrane protein
MEANVSHIEESIDVAVPVRTAYNQWTQFEEFPRFMEGVERVEQIDDTHLRWKAEVAGRTHEWEALITEQVPDRCVAWTSHEGPYNSGRVTFQPAENGKTRVTVNMQYEPQGKAEKAGDVLGVLKRRVSGDLKRFRDFIEDRGTETGAWRGEVRGGVSNPGSPGTNPRPGSL